MFSTDMVFLMNVLGLSLESIETKDPLCVHIYSLMSTAVLLEESFVDFLFCCISNVVFLMYTF